jgi:flagellar biosynthetic protein FlhB
MARPHYPIDLQLFAQEKTEKATPRKQQDARKKGQVAKSAELPSAIILLFVFLLLFFMGEYLVSHILNIFRRGLTEYLLWDLTIKSTDVMFKQLTMESFKILFPLLLVTLIAGILGNYLQIGFLFSTEPLKAKLNKINPLEGAKRILSIRSLVELVKSVLKVAATSSVAIVILHGALAEFPRLADKSPWLVASFVATLMIQLGLVISLLLVVIAIFDYMYQKYDHDKQQRMSKQDIKDEYKKTEGDPLIKGKIKEKQREMAMSRMMNELPKADVIITNPTHYAIAISYTADLMNAPVVLAKGKDFVALKMKEKAKEFNIVTMENRPLARALYDHVEIGEEVPEDLFKAVAEVLVYVYRLKGKVR